MASEPEIGDSSSTERLSKAIATRIDSRSVPPGSETKPLKKNVTTLR